MTERPVADNVSDWVIALSYFAIPLELAWFFVRYRLHNRANTTVVTLFVLFITLCGCTHVCNAMQWQALNHIMKLLTAAVSCATAAALVWVIPVVLSMPGRLAAKDDELGYENSMRVFNQTLVLCTRNLRQPYLIKLANETLRFMFPAARLAIVERGVQLRHELQEVGVDEQFVMLLDKDLYRHNTAFFEDVATQLATQQARV